MKLNLGCGSQIVDGWVNVDYALGARLFKLPFFSQLNSKLKLFELEWDTRIDIHDLTKKFPWNDNTIDAIYSSHTLEHFTRADGRFFLAECQRVLRKQGIIRIVVPDLTAFVKEYIEGKVRADEFLLSIGVLYEIGNNRIKKRLAPLIAFPHKCMYDTSTLSAILDEIGFEVTSKAAFDSEIHDIKKIEIEERTINAVIVEGKKK